MSQAISAELKSAHPSNYALAVSGTYFGTKQEVFSVMRMQQYHASLAAAGTVVVCCQCRKTVSAIQARAEFYPHTFAMLMKKYRHSKSTNWSQYLTERMTIGFRCVAHK